MAEVDQILPEQRLVSLKDGSTLAYDWLIIATGTGIHPEETEGLLGAEWRQSIFDFYTFEGAMALRAALATWPGGRLVVNVAEMPIKCPVAPLEFLFLADEFFARRGIRRQVELHYVTPLPGAFTKPTCNRELAGLLAAKDIRVTPDFAIARVDNANKTIVAWDDQVVPFDLLVTIPTNKGDAAIERSGLGDELGFVPTDPHNLCSSQYPEIFVIGDAANVPASKAGSVAHFESEVLTENVISALAGQPLTAEFDGHANCFIESGYGKGLLIDFNYEVEPLTGMFPLPHLGPFSLLRESTLNHWGKLAFRYLYWNMLLRGRDLPLVSARMSTAGKLLPAPERSGTDLNQTQRSRS
jgi:sulfide:quinone oxidoreductase